MEEGWGIFDLSPCRELFLGKQPFRFELDDRLAYAALAARACAPF